MSKPAEVIPADMRFTTDNPTLQDRRVLEALMRTRLRIRDTQPTADGRYVVIAMALVVLPIHDLIEEAAVGLLPSHVSLN